MQPKYTEDNIKSLKGLEHIRLRPGMYIGRLGDGTHVNDGIYILLKEIIDNSVDEFIMNSGNKIIITRTDDTITVRDFGRGIPLGKVVECVSTTNTGGKYDSKAFQFSVGLNGIGTKAVNALSSYFEVISYREGEFVKAVFKQGALIKNEKGTTDEANGTFVRFTPDQSIFGDYNFSNDFILDRLQNIAYLNVGLALIYNKTVIKSKNGLFDLLTNKISSGTLYDIISYKSSALEFAFTHTSSYGENYYSYANGHYTADGGTHLLAFKEGLQKGLNEHFKKSWTANSIRDGITCAVSIKVENPLFESQTKNKLGNAEIRTDIINNTKEAVVDYLLRNPIVAEKIKNKIIYNEKLQKEESNLRQKSKELHKKTSINIPKLKECKYHYNNPTKKHETEALNSMIFLTEGDSASGTITNSRNVNTQAVFSLRGKLENVFGKKRTEIYNNAELYNIMLALGLSDGTINNLRYSKVIIATDADVDGYHIRNLLMTYFLTYFEELVTSGHLFILETPLFRVRDKKQTIYCYSEKELIYAQTQIKKAEVTRFKGLGEISAKEFGQFISEDMKLLPVDINSITEARNSMEFCMSSNTSERKDYIMENMI